MLMTRRSRIWMTVAALFTVVNVAGAAVAAAQGEVLHSGAHVALSLLGALVVWWLVPGRFERRGGRREESAMPAVPSELTDRLTRIEQTLDAAAIEVERIGEAQRFMTRLLTENRTPRAPGQGAAEPIEIETREPVSHDHRF